MRSKRDGQKKTEKRNVKGENEEVKRHRRKRRTEEE